MMETFEDRKTKLQEKSNMENGIESLLTNNEVVCVKALREKAIRFSKGAIKECGDILAKMKILRRLNQSKQVLLIGDIVLDKYIYGRCTRLAGDSPNPVFQEKTVEYSLGGAGNVACNLTAMKLSVDLLAVVGELDTKVMKLLQQKRISTNHVIVCPNYRVRVAKRFLQDSCHLFRTDKNAERKVSKEAREILLENYSRLLGTKDYNAVIISDYRDELLTTDFVQRIICMAKEQNIPTLIDPKVGDYNRFTGASYIKPNREDATHFYGKELKTDEDILKACQTFSKRLGIQRVFLTLSEKGIVLYEQGTCENEFQFQTVHTDPDVLVNDVCGAGDTVLAALTFGISHGCSMEQTCFFANRCAANVIKRSGTVSVNMLEVIPDKVIYSQDELQALRSLIPEGKTIAATTGCFDMLHLGHITALGLAKEQADILVVALNSDVSVKKNKGDSRPIIPLKQRATTLASLDSVDFIVVFDEQVPHWVMKTMCPDVLVKGSDYTVEQVKKLYPYIENIYITPPINVNSTSSVIKKIKGNNV